MLCCVIVMAVANHTNKEKTLGDLSFSELTGYRAFRVEILKKCESNRRHDRYFYSDREEDAHPFLALREQILQLRRWVREHAQAMLTEAPNSEPYVRRVLRVPALVPLVPSERSGLKRLGQLFVPLRLTWPRVQSVIINVKTLEGRTFLYENIYKHVLRIRGFGHNEYYCPSIDAALRYLGPPALSEVKDLGMMDPRWVQLASRFGLVKISKVMPYARYGVQRLDGELAWILFCEKVVTSIAELDWLAYTEDRSYRRSEATAATRHIIRRMIRLMLVHGIAREQIANIFRYRITAFNPDQLSLNLNTLSAAGSVDPTAVFVATRDLMWSGEPDIWRYVVNEIGALTSADIGRFKQLLQSSSTLSIPLIQLLKTLGGNVDNLSQCQRLILAISRRSDGIVPLCDIRLLAGSPYSLSIDQIAQCTEYLTIPNKLQEYLQVLAIHGFGNASGIIAFQACYKNTSSSNLNVWLGMIELRGKGQSLEAVAEWVGQAAKEGHIDAYKYLKESIGLPEFLHLQRAEPIVRFGRGILSFLVNQKGLTSIQAIRDWYFRAHGVNKLRHWGELDASYNLLMEDAYNRNNFAFVASNYGCIRSAVQDRVVQQIGRRPYHADETTKDAYDKSYLELEIKENSKLLPILPIVLAETGGILLDSVLRHAWEPPQARQCHLAALTPLIDQLLSGGGPSNSQLGELESEAVAMLYKSTVQSVSSAWSQVCGRQSQLAGLNLSPHYPMRWDHAIRQLQAPLERSSLLALGHAKAYAGKFLPYSSEHIFDACKYLRAKRIRQSASDPWSLAAHLGVLIAAAHKDTLISEWVSRDLDATVHMPQEGADVAERLEQLEKMFSTTLPDALDRHVDGFVRRFSEADATFLAARLIGDEPSGHGGHAQLHKALIETRNTVMAVCQRWIVRERKKFSKDRSDIGATDLNAILTKHPASFFAKHAADLCTRDNTNMWDEARHAHLVVFDPKQRRLAGMALVYFEPIVELHADRNCLIIRAINPMDDMLATHTTSSIVDAFFDVAIQIAKDNGMAAVAFPAHCGMHLLSNLSSVEKDIEKRYIKPSITLPYRRVNEAVTERPRDWRREPRLISGRFYAYESGQLPVNSLYALWPGDLTN